METILQPEGVKILHPKGSTTKAQTILPLGLLTDLASNSYSNENVIIKSVKKTGSDIVCFFRQRQLLLMRGVSTLVS